MRTRVVAAASRDLLQLLSAAKPFLASISDEALGGPGQDALGKAQKALTSVENILGTLRAEVADTGTGIPEAVRHRAPDSRVLVNGQEPWRAYVALEYVWNTSGTCGKAWPDRRLIHRSQWLTPCPAPRAASALASSPSTATGSHRVNVPVAASSAVISAPPRTSPLPKRCPPAKQCVGQEGSFCLING